ncbi:hypothetical protein EK21DRAFT_119239 [Setomelanomma holmii]|uniref:Uncharacterized protein n=1 Tax=Setomelanomma holmii TaxID=210430 RepID=A0A9P4GWR4_9PLEO|nr:hypothetical protein EK21DRAFT_119239 [Setomelanomma holmii]
MSPRKRSRGAELFQSSKRARYEPFPTGSVDPLPHEVYQPAYLHPVTVTSTRGAPLAFNGRGLEILPLPDGPPASTQWFMASRVDLALPPLQQISGIPKNSRLQVQDARLMLVPFSLGQALDSKETQDGEYKKVWAAIKKVIANARQYELSWYKIFAGKPRATAEAVWQNIVENQAFSENVGPINGRPIAAAPHCRRGDVAMVPLDSGSSACTLPTTRHEATSNKSVESPSEKSAAAPQHHHKICAAKAPNTASFAPTLPTIEQETTLYESIEKLCGKQAPARHHQSKDVAENNPKIASIACSMPTKKHEAILTARSISPPVATKPAATQRHQGENVVTGPPNTASFAYTLLIAENEATSTEPSVTKPAAETLLAKSPEQLPALPGAAKKRKHQPDLVEESANKKSRVEVDLTGDHPAPKKKIVSNAQQKADLALYHENEEPINIYYLEGDPMRKKTDQYWQS